MCCEQLTFNTSRTLPSLIPHPSIRQHWPLSCSDQEAKFNPHPFPFQIYHTHSISQGSHRTSQHSKKKNKTTCAWKELWAHIAEGRDSKKRGSHFGYLFSTDTMLPLNVTNFLFILSQVYYYVFGVYRNLWKANGD